MGATRAEVKYTGCPHFPGETSGKSNTNIIVLLLRAQRLSAERIKDAVKDMVVNCLRPGAEESIYICYLVALSCLSFLNSQHG